MLGMKNTQIQGIRNGESELQKLADADKRALSQYLGIIVEEQWLQRRLRLRVCDREYEHHWPFRKISLVVSTVLKLRWQFWR